MQQTGTNYTQSVGGVVNFVTRAIPQNFGI